MSVITIAVPHDNDFSSLWLVGGELTLDETMIINGVFKLVIVLLIILKST
jgi:hypothetical protein